ncbi:MAG: hypothetical protein A2020_09975 [Lentisphaerae bacterium GWF2_45_14]|nr:MAG: hypothetical protein A2020_09975 [Lentisphaerae bacterium GWF2_45_14]
MINTGFAREVITPARGVSLVGYFNPRPNRGAYDDLYVKAFVFSDGRETAGIVSVDLCFVTTDIIDEVKALLAKSGITFAENILFSATHTHTGPYVCDFFGVPLDKSYIKFLTCKIVEAVVRAGKNLSPSEISYGSEKNNPLAFNRRFFMKNGKVVTNPGKLNPDIIKQEGTVDTETGALSVKKDGILELVIANIVNHTDTVGGDFVSADWPGRMEVEIQKKTGYDVPVITLIGASGNINHFDIKSPKPQCSYKESVQIGKTYAAIVLEILKKSKRIKPDTFTVSKSTIEIKARTFSKKEISEAEKIVKMNVSSSGKDLTSEDLAKGAGEVARFFASQLLEFNKKEAGRKRKFEIIAFKFGKNNLAITSLPGEPFTEIGLAIKKDSPFKRTFVASLSQGSCGYVPMKECFTRGGYEILPVQGAGSERDTEEKLINVSLRNLLTT